MTIYKATMRVETGQQDALAAALEDAASGVLIFEDPDAKSWTVEAIYLEEPAKDEIETLAAEAGAPLRMLSVAALPEIDWVKKSLEDLPPIRAGRFFVAGAHDIAKAPGGALRLQIEAAQAFGTGSHPTTKGCLLALDALAKRRHIARALDLGTGSGILTFALIRLFARPVLGTDIDPIAVETARENARINALHPRARFRVADGLSFGGRYDLIVANILAGPLKRLARPIAAALAPNGTVILSGLLDSQEVYVRAAYRAQNLRLVGRRVIDGWTTLILEQGSSRPAPPPLRRAGASRHRRAVPRSRSARCWR
jgi:ribosomal protein L11 methyltransferase